MQIAIAILALLISAIAHGQDHPAFAATQITQLTVESSVPDIVKLEGKAVEILRAKYGLSLDEARAKVRVDGKTDVARCLEFVIIDILGNIRQAKVVGTVVANQHPEPAK